MNYPVIRKREENRKLARKYLQEGKKREAWECFTKCVDITPEMARAFIKVCNVILIKQLEQLGTSIHGQGFFICPAVTIDENRLRGSAL